MKLIDSSDVVSLPPQLLLDTNVFRDLAENPRAEVAKRLRAIASQRNPTLLWTCDIVHQEIFAHLVSEEREHFVRFRDALKWIDVLCGDNGMACESTEPMRRAMHKNPRPTDVNALVELNRLRGRVVACNTFDDVRGDDRDLLAKVHEMTVTDKRHWAEKRQEATVLFRDANPMESERVPETKHGSAAEIVNDVLSGLFLATGEAFVSEHGPLQEKGYFCSQLREFLHFEAALLIKGRLRGFSFLKHENDYYDHMLCAFPAAGYTLVTGDQRLAGALRMAGCPSPRVATVDEGIETCERWIAASGGAR